MSRRKRAGKSKAERKQEQFEALARLRHIDRLTIDECADRLGVAPRTVQYWLADDAYQQTVEHQRQEWVSGAEYRAADLAQKAMKTIEDLMDPKTKSEFTRLQAAKTIGDWLGLGQQQREAETDDVEELTRLQRLLIERPQQPPLQVTNHFYGQGVEAGGFLPKALQGQPVDVSGFLKAPDQAGQPGQGGQNGPGAQVVESNLLPYAWDDPLDADDRDDDV